MLVQNIDINNKSISIVHFFSMSKLNANDPTHIHMHRKKATTEKNIRACRCRRYEKRNLPST